MRLFMSRLTVATTSLLALLAPVAGGAAEFVADFGGPEPAGWRGPRIAEWRAADGILTSPASGGVTGMLFAPISERDISFRVDVRLPEQGRRNVGLAFRFLEGDTGYLVRWYDQRNWLELLRYEKGAVLRVDGNHWQASSLIGSAPQKPGQWFTLEVQAIGDRVRARVWPADDRPADWQLDAAYPDTRAGAAGFSVDETVAEFRRFVALSGSHIADLIADERKRRTEQRRRRRSIKLGEDIVLEHGVCSAEFRLIVGVAPRAPELIFRARDEDNYYFARPTEGGLTLGKVVDGAEVRLAHSEVEWLRGPGRYRIEARISVADRDDRGPAWFINAGHVPPLIRIAARIRAAGFRQGSRWMVSTYDDPIAPGKRGEPYWQLDPFEHSSARRVLGDRVGWRDAPGVLCENLSVSAPRTRDHAIATVEPCRRIHTGDRGGCWLALGDLDGDGRLDYLAARNERQRVTALTAYANDGRELWRWGEGGGADIGYDVPATIHDIDLDGRAEVLCGIEGHLLVLDGATGEEENRRTLPEGLTVADCIVIANLRGRRSPADVIVKTRYDHLWAYTNEWELLWEFAGNTGHHPDVRDVDGDGRDEVLCGFSLIDDDGTILWQKDLPAHADAARLVRMIPDGPIHALNSCCGGNDLALTSLAGEFLWRQRPAITDFHFQTAHVGEIRRDVPGHEIVVDEGWARPGRARLALLSARGEWLGAFYVSYPRFHRIIDWDGDGVMEIVIPSDHVICNARGRVIAGLDSAPELGGPGIESPMARIADVHGDARDELILYNAREIVVFANPEPARRSIPPQPGVQPRYYNFTYY